MSNDKNSGPKYSNKSVKAISRWNATCKERKLIEKQLNIIRMRLEEIIKQDIKFDNEPPLDQNDMKDELTKNRKANNSLLGIESISFLIGLGINMDVDFTISTLDSSESTDLVGCFTYSVVRERRSGYQLDNDKIIKWFSFEKKPLISIYVDPQGKVTSPGGLDEEWWIYYCGKEPSRHYYNEMFAEIHYMVRDKIWEKALDWVNEDGLP